MNQWDNLRKTAESFGNDLDTQAAWERFAKKKKKKKRGFWIYFFGLGMLMILLSVGAWWFSVQSKSDAISSDSYSEVERTESHPISPKQVDKDAVNENTQSSPKENLDAPSDEPNLNTTDTKKQTTPRTAERENTKTKSNKKTTRKPSVKSSSTFDLLTQNDAIVSQRASSSQTNGQAEARAKTPQVIKKVIESTTDALAQTKNDLQASQSNKKLAKLKSLKTLSALSYESRPIMVLALDEIILMEENTGQTRKSYPWSAACYSFVGQAKRNYQTMSSPVFRDREKIEDFGPALRLDFLVSKNLNERFSVSAGLSLGQYYSKVFEVSQVLETDFLFEGVVIEERLKAGVTTAIPGSVIGSRTFVTEHVRYQKYRDLSIIVQSSYALIKRESFQVLANAGLGWAFLNRNIGETINQSPLAGEYTSLNDLGYRNNGSSYLQYGLQTNWNLNQFYSLSLGLRNVQDLNNRIGNTIGSDKFKSLGIYIGFSKTF